MSANTNGAAFTAPLRFLPSELLLRTFETELANRSRTRGFVMFNRDTDELAVLKAIRRAEVLHLHSRADPARERSCDAGDTIAGNNHVADYNFVAVRLHEAPSCRIGVRGEDVRRQRTV